MGGIMEAAGLLGQWLVPGGARGNGDEYVTSWDAAAIDRLKGQERQTLVRIIGQMGEESRVSQGLRQVLTSMEKMQVAGTRLYIVSRCREGRVECVGILKMGYKKLFIRMQNSAFRELFPLCCLDFYVHSSVQRGGLGRQLFQTMLQAENIPPHRIAYDRPSPKLFAFLKKHYGLSHFTPQENNFAVFHQYFDGDSGGAQSGRRSKGVAEALPHVELLTVEKGAAPLGGGRRDSARHQDEGKLSCRSPRGNSSLEKLWADCGKQDAVIKRDGGYHHRSRRRMVIDAGPRAAGAPRSERGSARGSERGDSREHAPVETRHVAVDSRCPPTNRSRWQEGRVMGANGMSLGSLQALLQPHVDGDCPYGSAGAEGNLERNHETHTGRRGKENSVPKAAMGDDLQMRSGIRGLQQMRKHGDDARDFNDEQYNAHLDARLKARPF